MNVFDRESGNRQRGAEHKQPFARLIQFHL
jgi:hypothetical protein